MKAKNTTLTAAVVLAMGATTTSQAGFDTTRDNLLIDIASGSLIEEGQQLQAQQRNEPADKLVVAKAAPKKKVTPKKKAAPKRK